MLLIGDCHGKFAGLKTIIKQCREEYPNEPIIQLGDFGLGFGLLEPENLGPNFYFIRGNHDNPAICQKHPNYLGDWGQKYFPNGESVFFVSGAYSVDYEWRTPGYTWWPDEELPESEYDRIWELYTQHKPDIVLSHDCPRIAYQKTIEASGRWPKDKPNRTSDFLLQKCFAIHPPKIWAYGHHHIATKFKIENTEFWCLNELNIDRAVLL